jgi:hypothetical protein
MALLRSCIAPVWSAIWKLEACRGSWPINLDIWLFQIGGPFQIAVEPTFTGLIREPHAVNGRFRPNFRLADHPPRARTTLPPNAVPGQWSTNIRDDETVSKITVG